MKALFHLPSGHTHEVILADWRGTPIEVGSHVIYAASAGAHSIEVYEAEIVDLKPETNHWVTRSASYLDSQMAQSGYDQEKFEKMIRYLGLGFKAKAMVIARSGGFSSWNKRDRITTFKKNERITVL